LFMRLLTHPNLFFSLPPPSSLSPPFFFSDTPPTDIYTLSLHDALPISGSSAAHRQGPPGRARQSNHRSNCRPPHPPDDRPGRDRSGRDPSPSETARTADGSVRKGRGTRLAAQEIRNPLPRAIRQRPTQDRKPCGYADSSRRSHESPLQRYSQNRAGPSPP